MVSYRGVLLRSSCILLILIGLLEDSKAGKVRKNTNSSRCWLKKLLHDKGKMIQPNRTESHATERSKLTERSDPTDRSNPTERRHLTERRFPNGRNHLTVKRQPTERSHRTGERPRRRQFQNRQPTKNYSQFGCDFDNENFFVKTRSIFAPVFGGEVNPMHFDNVEQFENLSGEIDKEYSRVIADVVLTDLPMMLDLYDAYKAYENTTESEKEKDISDKALDEVKKIEMVVNKKTDFLSQYAPTLHRHESEGLAVVLLERLIQRFPRMRGSVHLITSAEDVRVNDPVVNELGIQDLRGHNPDTNAREPPLFLFQHRHVAALLRFRIGDRLGYVLMDPGLNLESSVVIMADKESPHRAYTGEYRSRSRFTEFYLPRGDYVHSESGYRGYSEGHAVEHLYYIGRPFCSFLSSTIKPRLLKPKIHIWRRDEQAHALATVSFDLRVGGPRAPHLLMNLYGPEYANFIDSDDNRVPFVTREETESTRQLYTEVMKIMNYEGLEDMFAKAHNIIQDKEFVDYITEMDNLVDQVEKRKSDVRI